MQQFTDKAKTALQLAAKAAKDLHQSYIGSEHLLVALSVRRRVWQLKYFQDNGVDEIQLISMIKDLIAPESKSGCVGEGWIFTSRAARILEDSQQAGTKIR